jgi:small conductance mechanosensitive channel
MSGVLACAGRISARRGDMRRIVVGAGLLLVLLAPLAAWSQQRSAAEDETASSEAITIAMRVGALEQEIRQLRELHAKIEEAPPVNRGPLTFRRDERSLRLMRQVDELATEVLQLEESDPLRERLETQLVGDFLALGQRIFWRTDQLAEQISERGAALNDLSGVDRVLAEAEIKTLQSTRDAFFAAMVRHVEIRLLLGLSTGEILAPLSERLVLLAESLAGQLGVASAALEQLAVRLRVESNNADLKSAYLRAGESQAASRQRLRDIADMMARLDLDVAQYRALLIQYSTGISLELIQPDVMAGLLSDGLARLRGFFATRAPDLLLNLLLFLAILALFSFLARLLRRGLEAALSRSPLNMSSLLKATLVSISGGVVLIFGLLMALSQLGISLAPMLAGLGIAGFIVGFALQDTLGNFAAGAMILIYRPYDVDDFIEVAGVAGEVKKMNLVSTTITTYDNQTLVIPNGKIWGDVIKNVTGQRVRRVDLEFGIGYGDDIEKAERILAEAAADHELVLKNPPANVRVHSLGDSSVNLILRPWVRTADYWTVYWDLTREVKLRFDREGVTIPFPQRDVHFYPRGDT